MKNDWTATSVATLAATPATGTNQTTGLMISYTFTSSPQLLCCLLKTMSRPRATAAATKTRGAAAGLNFLLTEVFVNNTSKAFTGFTETLTDADLLNGKVLDAAGEKTLYGENGTDAHPAFSHFHPGNASTPFDAPKGFTDHYSQSLTWSGGTGLPNDNATKTGMNVRIHDIVVKGYQRNFILTITPTVAGAPEPASLCMMFTGMVAVVGYSLARRKRAGAEPGCHCAVVGMRERSVRNSRPYILPFPRLLILRRFGSADYPRI